MKTYTIEGKIDGFGAQYNAIMSGIAYCEYMNYQYEHTPFRRIDYTWRSGKYEPWKGTVIIIWSKKNE